MKMLRFRVAVVDPAKAYAQQLGFNVVFSEAYAPNTTDFSAIIDKVIASKPTVLMGGGHYADGSTLARQLYDHKVNLKMITLLVAPDSPQWSELGDAAVGVIVPSQWEPQTAFKAQYGPSGAEFRQGIHGEIQCSAELRIGWWLRCGLILQRAIEQAGGTDTAKVAAALNATDITTFYGSTKFATAANEHGLQIGHSMVLAQWQKDKSGTLVKQVVWPLAGKSANLVYPIRVTVGDCARCSSRLVSQRVGYVWHLSFHDRRSAHRLGVRAGSDGTESHLGSDGCHQPHSRRGHRAGHVRHVPAVHRLLHINAYLLLLPIIAAGLVLGLLIYWTSVHWVIGPAAAGEPAVHLRGQHDHHRHRHRNLEHQSIQRELQRCAASPSASIPLPGTTSRRPRRR